MFIYIYLLCILFYFIILHQNEPIFVFKPINDSEKNLFIDAHTHIYIYIYIYIYIFIMQLILYIHTYIHMP